MYNHFRNISLFLVAASAFTACDLDEYNPTMVTADQILSTEEGLYGMQAKCYEPIYAQLYSVFDFMSMAECGTDIWWSQNDKTNNEQMFFYEGLTSTTNKPWDKAFTQMYASLGLCNTIINHGAESENATVGTLVAEAYFLRAYYHLMLTTYYGPITLVLNEPSETPDLKPVRNTLSEIYSQIISDLNYAKDHLPIAPLNGNRARATKKAALGMLCRAYIQGAGQGLSEGEVSYWQRAKEVSEDFIENRAKYDATLYEDVSDLWADTNNRNNKEALFLAAGQDATDNTDLYNASSSWTNKLFTYCYFNMESVSALSLISDAKTDPLYGRCNNNLLAPSEYLLRCFNPTWDKRWENSFQTAFFGFSQEQTGEKSYKSAQVTVGKKASSTTAYQKWGQDASAGGAVIYPYVDLKTVNYAGGGNQYPAQVWPKGETSGDVTKLETVRKIYVIDYPLAADDNRFFMYLYPDWADEYKDGYDKTGRVYSSIKISDLFSDEATDDGQYRHYVKSATEFHQHDASIAETVDAYKAVPSLNKFMWNYEGVFYGSNLQIRNGDVAVMRMAEVYLIAAEAEQHLGNGAKAAEYLNDLRRRAARATASPADYTLNTATEDDIFDEYAREMCGEFQRWALLQRHQAFTDRLAKYNGRAAKNYKPHMIWRPISATFLQQIDNKEQYGDNGYGTTPTSGLDGFLQ